MEKIESIDRLDKQLKDFQFIRTGNNLWNKKYSNSVIVINMQSSKFTDAYFMNIGIVITKLLAREKKKYTIEDCSFVGRYNELIDSNDENDIWLNKAGFDVDRVLHNIRHLIVPYLEQLSDAEFLINNIHEISRERKVLLQYMTYEDLKSKLSK